MDLRNEVAVVTGGASGIGAAIVEALRVAGAKPVVWDMAENPDIVCDVTDPTQVASALEHTTQLAGVPRMLFACAGIVKDKVVLEVDLDDWERVFSVNVKGVLLCMRAIAGGLIRSNTTGSILAISSVNSMVADAGLAGYSASKAAVNMLVKIAAVEWGEHGIRVNAVGPGVTATPILRFASDPEYLKNVSARTPLGDIGQPEYIAEAALNIVRSDWITGQIVMVDGGSSLMTARSSWWNARNAG